MYLSSSDTAPYPRRFFVKAARRAACLCLILSQDVINVDIVSARRNTTYKRRGPALNHLTTSFNVPTGMTQALLTRGALRRG